MARSCFLSSLTRISDLARHPWALAALPRGRWERGDYVVGRVAGVPTGIRAIELDTGRMTEVMANDLIVGAFGTRAATLEGVGDWTAIGDDLRMQALTPAGLFGRTTSLSPLLPSFLQLEYCGHVLRGGRKCAMSDFVIPAEPRDLQAPVVLIVGTSMSAGKTTAGRAIVHEFVQAGLRVSGVKLTGAGRYRDILSLADAGADHVLDFVDVGLPSTMVPEDVFRAAARDLLSRVAMFGSDVVVVEAGASPLEPYNGAAAIDELGDRIRCTVLCASDPYAVVGVQTAFRMQPDFVAGPAANTEAGIALVAKLTGVTALNILDPGSAEPLRELLARKLPSLFRG